MVDYLIQILILHRNIGKEFSFSTYKYEQGTEKRKSNQSKKKLTVFKEESGSSAKK